MFGFYFYWAVRFFHLYNVIIMWWFVQNNFYKFRNHVTVKNGILKVKGNLSKYYYRKKLNNRILIFKIHIITLYSENKYMHFLTYLSKKNNFLNCIE